MARTLRIAFLLLTLAWASVTDATAAQHRKQDRLRWNDVAQQEAPQAIIDRTPSSCRLVPVRPQRISPSGDSKTQPTHGRTCSAFSPKSPYAIGSIALPSRHSAHAMLPVLSAKTFIVLRHIIR